MNVLIFDGHIRNIENLKYDIYTTFTISTAVEVSFLLKHMENFFGKKCMVHVPSSMGHVSCKHRLKAKKINIPKHVILK